MLKVLSPALHASYIDRAALELLASLNWSMVNDDLLLVQLDLDLCPGFNKPIITVGITES